jgi:hypothetical protein
MAMKALKIGLNQKGRKYALVTDRDGTFSVWTLCANYASHVHGGIAHTWRYVNRRLDLETADNLYQKRLAGRR